MPPHTLTFVVEDGTGIPEANSFITYEFARQFWFDHGYGDFAATDPPMPPALPTGFMTAAAAVAGDTILSLDQDTTVFPVAENQYVGATFTLPHNATPYTIESHDPKTTIDTTAVAFVVTAGLVIEALENSDLAPLAPCRRGQPRLPAAGRHRARQPLDIRLIRLGGEAQDVTAPDSYPWAGPGVAAYLGH